MRIEDPNSRTMQKDYDQSDVAHLLRKRDWRSYDEMITWLQQEGDADARLTPGEVAHMVQDMSKLKKRKAQFIKEPDRLYHELKH